MPASAAAIVAPQAAGPEPTQAAVPSPEPRPATDLPRVAALDLSLRALPPGSDRGVAVPAPRLRLDVPERRFAPEVQSPEALIGAKQAQRRVENGLVDPYFGELGKALLANWNAEAHVQAHGLRGWVQQMGENTRVFQDVWRENARRYASAGSPIASDTPMPMVVERTGQPTSAAARDAYGRQLKEQFKSRKRALVRVVQSKDGVLRSVTLVEGSNDPTIDREAVADVKAAASKLPPPPPEGLGIKEPIVSLWEFQLVVSISPPVPSIAFEFDEALAFLDVRLPLDRRIYKIVKLVGVE